MVYKITIPNLLFFPTEFRNHVRAEIEACEWRTNAMDAVSLPCNRDQLDVVTTRLSERRVSYQVEDLGEGYTHIVTTAPVDYDYRQMTVELFRSKPDDFGKVERHVAIRKGDVDHQTMRYQSGLYTVRRIS